MKRITTIIVILFAVIVFPIKIGLYYNPPKIIDEKNGIFPELLNYIFEKENIKPDYIFDTFPDLIKKLESGEIDALACLGYSKERAENFDFNKEFILSDWAVVYINHKSNIVNIFDLENKRIGVLKDDIYYTDEYKGIKKILENFDIKVRFYEFDSYEDIFKALSKNKIDAAVVNRTFGLANSDEYNLIPTDIVFSPLKIYIAFNKNYPEKNKIIKILDENIRLLKYDYNSIYYEILNKYLYVQKEKIIPKWVKLFVFISFFLIITLIINHYVLVKLVEKRTKQLRKLNMELRKKNEELESFNEEITSQNEELETLYIHNEKLQNSLKILIKTISNIEKEKYLSEDLYLIELFDAVTFILEGIEYAELIKYENSKKIFLKRFGKKALRENLKDRHIILSMDNTIKYSAFFKFAESLNNLEITNETLESFKTLAYAFLKIKEEAKLEEKFREDIIKSLISFLEQHDEYTKNHSKMVAECSRKIAQKLNLSEELQRKIFWSALLHDIGKILIPNNILNKNGGLTEEEYNQIKMHPVYAYNALINSEGLKEIAIGVRHHHERWDGKGYPDGLKGKEIPLISQIIGVADAWDAMTSSRAYRKAMDKEKSIEEIEKNSGKQFSPEIVEVFLAIIRDENN
ncbi:HD domain-containing phosphohydrolase [Marinitoga sp. 1154]|uniref:HD domain-containing phosphohydrolase n=1 Tax=Marinitoga sp. 1154 TaxID=1643335 RepID=UPI0015867BC1|nr:HD domain-containing phosphohydrolase [Marinitoga sp. 1154]